MNRERRQELAVALRWCDRIINNPEWDPEETYECGSALRTLHFFGGSLPKDVAWKFYGLVRQKPDSSLHVWVFKSLARTDPAKAMPILAEGMRSEDQTVRDNASDAWLIAQGLPTAWQASDAACEGDLDDKPGPLQYVHVLVGLIVQVQNGGLSQWFCNGYGVYRNLTKEAARAVGATETPELIEQAIGAFGAPDDLDEMQMDEVVSGPQNDAIAKRLEPLTDRFHEDHDRLVPRIAEYMVRHRHVFEGLSIRSPEDY